ncbi:hypothetical protein ACFQ8C_24880 [Streptomyces sp. NPDC056503]|uniref:hypothetical protein n=1 Tax=Streptomyces sp. NPDC056503 TaxID=3345842 RepID=UPI00369F8927
MPEYSVTWTIDIDADTPALAAAAALGIQRDHGSSATVFTVHTDDGDLLVDLDPHQPGTPQQSCPAPDHTTHPSSRPGTAHRRAGAQAHPGTAGANRRPGTPLAMSGAIVQEPAAGQAFPRGRRCLSGEWWRPVAQRQRALHMPLNRGNGGS